MGKYIKKMKKGVSFLLVMSMVFTQMIGGSLTVMAEEVETPGELKEIIYETFTADAEHIVDQPFKNKMTMPGGWEPQAVGIYKTMGYEGSLGLKFTHFPSEKEVITPEFELKGEGKLSFWAASNYDKDKSVDVEKVGNFTIRVQTGGEWILLDELNKITDEGKFYEYDLEAGTNRIKFEYDKPNPGYNLRVDEIKIMGSGTIIEEEPVLLTELKLALLEEMEIGESQTAGLTYISADTTQKDIEWTSSDPAVATIDNGKITARSAGTTTITARSEMNPSVFAEADLTVAEKEEVSGLVIEGQVLNKKLPAGWVTSEAPDFYGGPPALKMTGWYDLISPEFKLLSDGQLSFYIKSNNARSGGTTGDLLINTSTIIVEQLLPSGWGLAEEIKLEMSNATFDTITASLDGAARQIRISYQKEGGNIGMDNFVVSQAPDAIEVPITGLTLSDLEVGTEESKSMEVAYEPSNTTQKWLNWELADETVATVNAYGEVKGNKKGETKITARSTDNPGISGTAKVMVKDTKAPTLEKASPKGSGARRDASITIILADDTGLDTQSIRVSLDDVDITELFIGSAKEEDGGILLYELSYKPETNFEEKTYTLKLSAKDILGFEMSEEWTFSVGEHTKGNLYFGNIHSHTNLSDGAGSIDEAYTWARDNAKADYIAVTDHSNWFDNDKAATFADGSMSDKWKQGLAAANKYNDNGKFTAMYGFEMTWSNGTGHMNTYNTPGFETRSNGEIDLQEYYRRLLEHPESISQFNHPGTTFGDFRDFGFYSKEIDELVTMIEVGNGEGPVRGSGYFPSYEYYTRALDKGWHVSPTNNQDNHKRFWVNANTARTVIEAPSLTRDDLYDAMRQRRTYATEDENVEISFTVNSQAMGSLLDSPEELNLAITVSDPDGDKVSQISIIGDGGAVVKKQSFDCSDVEWNLTLEPEYSYYYVRVDMANKDIAVTAPVWAGETIPVGLTAVAPSSEILEVGEEFELITSAFNNTDISFADLKIEYFRDRVEEANKIAESTMANLSAADLGEVKTKLTMNEPGEHNIYARATFVVKGQAKVSVVSTRVKVLNPEDMLKVVVDGGHFNDYVSSYYKDGMDGLDRLLAKKEAKMIIHSEKDQEGNYVKLPMTDDVLKGASLLVLTTPESDSRNSRYPYTDEDIAAIVRFAKNGGNIIMTSRGDRSNAKPEETNFRNAQVGNKLLEALGSNLRFNNNLVVDDVVSENVTYRLKFKHYRQSPYGLTEGLTSEDIYNFYNGCSVSLKEGADASKVTFPLEVHETTGTVVAGGYADYVGDIAPEAGTVGNTEIVGAEVLADGGKLIVSGSTFFSSFEIKEDNINGNYKFTQNVLDWMVEESEAELKTIAEIQEGYPANRGQRYMIEGTVTSQSEAVEPKNSFFEVIYVQDETGGLTIFGVSDTPLKAGQKVRLTGIVGEYQGDTQIRVWDESLNLQIIDESINPVGPKKMSTKESMKEENMGWLTSVTGKVTRMDASNLWLDDGSGEARIYVEGYIWDGENPDSLGKWDPTIKLGDLVSAIGLAAKDPEGSRLRVRNTGEIVRLLDPGSGDLPAPDKPSVPSNPSQGGSRPKPAKPIEKPIEKPVKKPIEESVVNLQTGQLMVGQKQVNLYVKPFIAHSRTFMGVRDIALIIGIKNEDIKWNPQTKTVTFNHDGKTVEMVIGKKEMKVDDLIIQLDVAPFIVEGRTCIPVAKFARTLGLKVDFNSTTKEVIFK